MRAAPRLSALAASACQAQALAALGDRDQARQIVERVLAQETGSNAEISWASGIAAELAEKSGDLVGAEARLQRALDSAGGAHYPRVAYAEFLLRRQRCNALHTPGGAYCFYAVHAAGRRGAYRRHQLCGCAGRTGSRSAASAG
jgi:hypothetical protein